MPVFTLDEQMIFPAVELSEPDGLLAVGGDLSPERLLLAYCNGIFPWYSGRQILWWSPDPRFVLYPENLKISKSMKALFKKGAFRVTVNKAFEEVISNCKEIKREGQSNTWITPQMKAAYLKLHELGFAHSVEAWQGEELVGGLYGIWIKNAFFGESMFSKVSNASKFAFISFVLHLEKEGVKLIDCQVYTEHLESLGAEMIPRDRFINEISGLIQ